MFRKLKKLMKLKFRLRLRRQPKKLKDDTTWMWYAFSPRIWLTKLLSFNFPKRASRANSFNFFNFPNIQTSET